MSNVKLENRLSKLQEKYKEIFEEVERDTIKESEKLEDESDGSIAGKFKIEIEMVEQKISFDLPSITSGYKEIIFSVPEVTMKTKKIVWHVPELKMERRKVGERPEIVCRNVRNSFGIMGEECRTRWKPIYSNIPVTEMVKKEIKIDLPKITMKDHSIEVPDVKIEMKRQEVILHLPSITFSDVEVEIKKESKELKRNTDNKVARVQMNYEAESKKIISEECSIIFDLEIDKLLEEEKSLRNIFDPIITDMKNKIKSIKSQGATSELKKLEDQLTSLVEQYNIAINQIGDSIEALNEQREELIDSII